MWKWRDRRKDSDCKDLCDTNIYVSIEPVQKDTVIEINKLLYQFIWKGKDKVNRLSLRREYRDIKCECNRNTTETKT